MNHFATTIALVAAMALAIGCGRAEEAANDAAKATQDAASAATARVEGAAAKAGSAADAAAAKAKTTAESAVASANQATPESAVASANQATPDVAASATPAETCLDLTGRKAWVAAVEPCTQAAKQSPDDLKIRHALQQAQAGAADAARSALQ